ncbi:MAG: adenosylcobinamide amidohydrolase [Deltaproteobacteria bacterium]|nr:adenosylcobinamide amidohydrolase [Deltaproteobacteria bacterium]
MTPAAGVRRDGRWLFVHLGAPHRLASWAIVGGGLRRADTVAWLRVCDADLRPPVDARRYLADQLASAGCSGAVGLLTSRDLDAYVEHAVAYQDVRARCITTVGLGNALRAGDPPGASARIGTINTLCQLSTPLTDNALLEALALAAEARALVVREAGVASQRSGLPASGTGTDCIVIAAPDRPRGAAYAGKHTAIGHVIGASVHDATRRGVAAWQDERARSLGR